MTYGRTMGQRSGRRGAGLLAALVAGWLQLGPPPAARAQGCASNFVITKETLSSVQSCQRTVAASGGVWRGRFLERGSSDAYCQFQWRPTVPVFPIGGLTPIVPIAPVLPLPPPIVVAPVVPAASQSPAGATLLAPSSAAAVVVTPPTSPSGSPGGTAPPPPPPSLVVSRTTVSFPMTLPGGASDDQEVRLQNVGAVATGPLTIQIAGWDAPQFALVGNTCSSLAPGAVCALQVRFLPTKAGDKRSELSVRLPGVVLGAVTLRGSAFPDQDGSRKPDLSVFAHLRHAVDCPVLAAQALPPAELVLELQQVFAARAGKPRAMPPQPPPTPVRVAVIDSAVPPLGGSDRTLHGRVVGRTIAELSGLGAASIHNHLALPLLNAESPEEDPRGGYFGTVGHFVAAVRAALDAAEGASERQVINLSLGWERTPGSAGAAATGRLAEEAALAVLHHAACRGALVVAAAGNGFGEGPLYPAAFQGEKPLTLAECRARGFEPRAPTGPLSRPLLYAVGALDSLGRPLAVSRRHSISGRVAHGLGFLAADPAADEGFRSIMSGTSLAAAVVSGAAAALWRYQPTPSVSGYDVMKKLEATGEPTAIPAAACMTAPCRFPRILLCRALLELGGGPCPDTSAQAMNIATASADRGSDPTAGTVASEACGFPVVPGCDDNRDPQAFVLPQPGSPGCKECIYDRTWDVFGLQMQPAILDLGVTVARVRYDGRALDIRKPGPFPLKLDPQVWASTGLPYDWRPWSPTVQFGVYLAGIFIPKSVEETVIVSDWTGY